MDTGRATRDTSPALAQGDDGKNFAREICSKTFSKRKSQLGLFQRLLDALSRDSGKVMCNDLNSLLTFYTRTFKEPPYTVLPQEISPGSMS
jgi:hypothetical protein